MTTGGGAPPNLNRENSVWFLHNGEILCKVLFFAKRQSNGRSQKERWYNANIFYQIFFQTSGGLVIYVVCSLLWYFSFLIFKKLLYVRYLKSNNAARRVLDILEANYDGNIKNNQMNPDEFFLNIDNSIMIIRNSKLKMQVATS